jgi:hypothetical protein
MLKSAIERARSRISHIVDTEVPGRMGPLTQPKKISTDSECPGAAFPRLGSREVGHRSLRSQREHRTRVC